jgi:hypothetical protein
VLPRPSAALTPQARLPRRPEGQALSLPYEPLARAKLRGHGPSGAAGRLADHIPDPADIAPTSTPTTPIASAASGRTRRSRATEMTWRPPPRRRCSPSWARLIAKVFQPDPLECRRCGGPLKVVAYITDALPIRQILDHLDLGPPEKPPRQVRDVLRAPSMTRGERSSSSRPNLLSATPASPHSGSGICAQGKSPAMSAPPTLRQRARPSEGTVARPADGLRGSPDPSPAAPASVGRRFNALWISGRAARSCCHTVFRAARRSEPPQS